ncbi:hypothetical protein F4779DRAFT_361749 [Xylariaceae sp. FL0662B]|nr:hypothetical protein F4779DRAFT_361749 [Xylariaceae sp. FL0662B]
MATGSRSSIGCELEFLIVAREQESTHLQAFRDWVVKDDRTVKLPIEVGTHRHVQKYRWKSVEITSPVLWATEASFAEIHEVVKAIAETYWVYAPPSSGLHWHYGRGRDWIPFGNLRKIAAFLHAADPILVQMHPQSRHNNNDYCASNRFYTAVAHGVTAAQGKVETEAEEVEEEAVTITKLESGFKSEPKASAKKRSDFPFAFGRGSLPGYVFNEDIFEHTTPNLTSQGYDDSRVQLQPTSIQSAVREIFLCTDALTLSLLMSYLVFRPAYSFQWALAPRRSRKTQEKRTIEFRQSAGTMDADEVVAHGRIAVRLCEFAAAANPADLWKMILDFASAEARRDWYDVFDLLVELDLVEEAKVIERRLVRERGIGIMGETGR